VDYDGISLEDAVREHGAGSRYLSGDAPLAPLPGTQAEIDSIQDLHARLLKGDAQILKGSKASKATLVAILPGRRFVHLATHGWFAPESRVSLADAGSERTGARGRTRVESLEQTVAGFAPMTLCGLALAGANVALRGEGSGLGSFAGILTAEELCAVDLSRCELAVLSACETNAGIRRAGQGMQSLQAALHAAGARSAITSLWRVDDAATRELMERFYTYLWQEHLPKADALWRAKLDLRKAGHPVRNWAGWVLSGDPL
jgi:CHAT domain-containing protein